jgi:hypothetical protein
MGMDDGGGDQLEREGGGDIEACVGNYNYATIQPINRLFDRLIVLYHLQTN